MSNGWSINRDASGTPSSLSWSSRDAAPRIDRTETTAKKRIGAPVLPGLFDPPIATALSPLAKHCSSMGAQDAKQKADRQALALLSLYQSRGAQTDQEAADALGIQRNSVNARRATLIKLGLVDPQPKGTRKNTVTGISNSTWGLR